MFDLLPESEKADLAGLEPEGGGLQNMLTVRVCAAHMGGFLGPKLSKQGY